MNSTDVINHSGNHWSLFYLPRRLFRKEWVTHWERSSENTIIRRPTSGKMACQLPRDLRTMIAYHSYILTWENSWWPSTGTDVTSGSTLSGVWWIPLNGLPVTRMSWNKVFLNFIFIYFNFFRIRFGLVHVDFKDPNRTRTLKLSARWLKEVIRKRKLIPFIQSDFCK